MKNTLVLIAVAFNGFRIFPLWALLCIKQYILRDEYALLFKRLRTYTYGILASFILSSLL